MHNLVVTPPCRASVQRPAKRSQRDIRDTTHNRTTTTHRERHYATTHDKQETPTQTMAKEAPENTNRADESGGAVPQRRRRKRNSKQKTTFKTTM